MEANNAVAFHSVAADSDQSAPTVAIVSEKFRSAAGVANQDGLDTNNIQRWTHSANSKAFVLIDADIHTVVPNMV